MREKVLRLFLTAVFISNCISVFSQEKSENRGSDSTIIDSLKNSGVIFNDNQKRTEIVLSTSQAVRFLQQRFQSKYWNHTRDPFRLALGQLIYEASHPPYDSTEYILNNYPYDSLNIPWEKFYIWEPLRLKIPVISNPEFTIPVNSAVKTDTNVVAGKNDSINLKPLIIPKPFVAFKPVSSLKDTTIMVVIDTLNEVTSSSSGFPFRYYNFPFQGDSIKAAVRSLLDYLDDRDSTVINFTGVGKTFTPIMMNSKSDKVICYWLKNEFSDSIAIWIDNPSRNTFGLYLEQGVNFRRPVQQRNYSNAKVNVQLPDNSKLRILQNITIKPQYWKYRKESSFVLSQTSFSNWVKGGDNSISTSMDITCYADYNNVPLKLSSNNFIRLNLGFLKSGDIPLRKNIDLLETNSKLNHKAFGKFDFSAILLFKSQIAPGYDYSSETSKLVSKFMNPAVFTMGLGLDYQPNKTTSLNFSPFSYKATFMTDTAHIDQTKYGIPKNRKSLIKPGASFMITNECKPLKTVSIINRLQLFTNYIHNPQNVDVDWEMIADVNLNWFTDVHLDTHLIYNDDTKTPELDKNKNPVLMPDGSVKKTARIQFKEILGISFVLRF
jgi:hypothetical protein